MAMQNYRDLATPSPPPMPTGPNGGPLAGPPILPLAPDIDLTIGNGDILDYSY